MELTTLLVFSIIFVISLMYTLATRPRGLPPGPTTVPFIGNLNLVFKSTTFHLTMDRLCKQYGGLFSLQMGYQPAIVISDVDLLREALVKKAEYFSDRPTHLLLLKALYRGNGFVFQNGKKWEKLRRIVITSMRKFGVGKVIMENRIEEECLCIIEEIEKSNGGFYPNKLFQRAVCNVVCSILFGKRFDYTSAEFNNFLNALTTLFGNGGFQNFAIYLNSFMALAGMAVLQPSIMKLPLATYKTRQFVRRRIQERRDTFDIDNIRDFIDVYLETQMKSDTSVNDQMIFQTIMDVFFAGTETTSTTLMWAFLFFIQYPEVQEKCRHEIVKVVGQNRKPTIKDREHLPYIEATIKEVMRIGSPTPVGGLHCTSDTVELAGYVIPKNTVVITNYYSMHLDPNLWPKPYVLRPERFIDESGKLIKTDDDMPFSVGKRKCLGDNLARMELFLIITSLLQRYRFRAKSEESLPRVDTAEMGVTLVPPYYEMIAEKLI